MYRQVEEVGHLILIINIYLIKKMYWLMSTTYYDFFSICSLEIEFLRGIWYSHYMKNGDVKLQSLCSLWIVIKLIFVEKNELLEHWAFQEEGRLGIREMEQPEKEVVAHLTVGETKTDDAIPWCCLVCRVNFISYHFWKTPSEVVECW